MKIIADLELHSKYSRAVSPQMNVSEINKWAGKKGIGLVGTGDFTHPMWLRELEANLESTGEGVFKFRGEEDNIRFMLTTEVSCIYKYKDRARRVHFMVYLPSFSAVKEFCLKLTKRGANLFSDGRPIMGISLYDVAKIALEVDKDAILIPAHVWTPWFGYYGQMSGFDHLSEAFGDLSEFIPAVETGLSSDPAMNWRIAELTGKAIVSFGDAHSPLKLGREATVFDLRSISFKNVRRAIVGDEINKISYTIEFYPEEGKYHYTGHRKCKVCYSAKEAKKNGFTCPLCKKKLTMGVLSRVEELADSDVEIVTKLDSLGVRWISERSNVRPAYIMLVPLLEIIAESLEIGVGSKGAIEAYEKLISVFGNEFNCLLNVSVGDIAKIAGMKISEGIKKVRSGDIVIQPGYDGVFGKVKVWKEDEAIDQTSLF